MKKEIKELAWLVPSSLLWYYAAGRPFEGCPLWAQMLGWLGVYVSFTLIRWGLKK